MLKTRIIAGYIMRDLPYIVGFLLAAVLLSSAQSMAANPRVAVDIADVTASPDDSIVAVPVRISFPQDSLAGIEIYFRIGENPHLKFASDDVREDDLFVAADTSGTIMSGWELVSTTTPENTMYDLKVSGMAFWINEGTTPAAAPADTALLTTLYIRLENRRSLLPGKRIDILIDQNGTSFSDPQGNSIGVVTTHERRCAQYVNDSCVSWKIARVGRLDTSMVVLDGGSITIVEPEVQNEGTAGSQK